MIRQRHDELIWEGDVEVPELADLTEIHIPFEVKRVKRWEE